MHDEGVQILENLLSIRVPVLAAVEDESGSNLFLGGRFEAGCGGVGCFPVPHNVKPMQPIPNEYRATISGWLGGVYDPNYVAPYIQNFTLAVTRSVRQNMTVDVRYTGTRGLKLFGDLPLNSRNFLTNGLKEAFDAARYGQESELLDRMFHGVNIAGAGHGPVGTVFNGVPQTGALHLRAATASQIRNNLANGNYASLAQTLSTLNYIKAAGRNADLLHNAAEAGKRILFCEPSCLSVIREDAPSLLRGEARARAEAVARASMLVEEFLAASGVALPLRSGPAKILMHGHCHQKSMGLAGASRALLQRIWNQVHERTAIAVVAPAGFGKTTLLTQWRRLWLEQGAIVPWLSADAQDDPARFVFGLLHALRVGLETLKAANARQADAWLRDRLRELEEEGI